MREAGLRFYHNLDENDIPYPRSGAKHSYQTREKLRQKMFHRLEKLKKEGKPHYLKGRKNLGWKGKHHAPETIEKLRKANLGKNNPSFGKSPSEKTRMKLRIANAGQKRSKEFIEKARIINSGKNNPSWKGGIIKVRKGYIMIHSPNHPHKTYYGYVFEHRLIVEAQIGRYLKPEERCHHINKTTDDNRPENLMAFKSNSAHQVFESGKNKIEPSDIIFDGRNL